MSDTDARPTGGDVPAPLLLVAGMARSGSTLLGLLVGRRVAASTVLGEVRHLWTVARDPRHLCGCGRPLGECPFWQGVLEQAFGGLSPGEADDRVRLLAATLRVGRLRELLAGAGEGSFRSADLEECRQLHVRLFEAIRDRAPGGLLIDLSKGPLYGLLLASVDPVRLSVVHLVRDPRGVAYSFSKSVPRRDVTWERRDLNSLPAGTVARRWIRREVLASLLARRAPSSIRVRYEDLARRPEATLDEVVATVDLPTDSAAVPSTDHGLAGNPMRFGDEPLRVRLDDAWRHELSAADRRVVTALTAPALLGYGYPLRAGSDGGHGG